jgi:hypothetical protein
LYTLARQAVIILALPALFAPPALAQWGIWPADSLLAQGHLAEAESSYYAAVRARPRDPLARTALGRFLAARGATRVGAVLVEEARAFGGDSATLAGVLVPLYMRLGDYTAIDSLRPAVLPIAERRRAKWLREKPPGTAFADSVVVLTYRPLADGSGIGTVMLRLRRTELLAVIDPRVSGLVVPEGMRRDMRRFGGDKKGTVAVADAVRLGGIAFANVPAAISAAGEKVRIGFDVLAPFSPSFDPIRGVLILHRVERHASTVAGSRIPALFDTNGLRLLIGQRWQASSAAMPAMLLATRTWTWDGKRGDLVLMSR